MRTFGLVYLGPQTHGLLLLHLSLHKLRTRFRLFRHGRQATFESTTYLWLKFYLYKKYCKMEKKLWEPMFSLVFICAFELMIDSILLYNIFVIMSEALFSDNQVDLIRSVIAKDKK